MYGGNSKSQRWMPSNPQKYAGDYRNIISRSSYETKFFNWVDKNPSVIEWHSEETVVPYVSPVDGRHHRYFLDAKMKVKSNDGKITTYLVEIKPEKFTKPPATPKRKTARYIAEVCQWGVNSAKWDAATEYCLDRGWKFVILTEKHLGIKR